MLLKLNLIDLVINNRFSQVVRFLILISFVIRPFSKISSVQANILHFEKSFLISDCIDKRKRSVYNQKREIV